MAVESGTGASGGGGLSEAAIQALIDASVSPSTKLGFYGTGLYYSAGGERGGTSAIPRGNVHVVRYWVEEPQVFDRILAYAGATGAGILHPVVYDDLNGRPNDLLVNAGAVTEVNGTYTEKVIDLEITEPSFIWFGGFAHTEAFTTMALLNTWSPTANVGLPLATINTATSWMNPAVYRQTNAGSSSDADIPNPFGAALVSDAAGFAPMMWLRAAGAPA